MELQHDHFNEEINIMYAKADFKGNSLSRNNTLISVMIDLTINDW